MFLIQSSNNKIIGARRLIVLNFPLRSVFHGLGQSVANLVNIFASVIRSLP